MDKKRRLQKPMLAESNSVIGFVVAMLLAFLGMLYEMFRFHPTNLTQAEPTQVPLYFSRVADALPFPPTLQLYRRGKTAADIWAAIIQKQGANLGSSK